MDARSVPSVQFFAESRPQRLRRVEVRKMLANPCAPTLFRKGQDYPDKDTQTLIRNMTVEAGKIDKSYKDLQRGR